MVGLGRSRKVTRRAITPFWCVAIAVAFIAAVASFDRQRVDAVGMRLRTSIPDGLGSVATVDVRSALSTFFGWRSAVAGEGADGDAREVDTALSEESAFLILKKLFSPSKSWKIVLSKLGIHGTAWRNPLGSADGGGLEEIFSMFHDSPFEMLFKFAADGNDRKLFDDDQPRFNEQIESLREHFVGPSAEYWKNAFLGALDKFADTNALAVSVGSLWSDASGAGVLSERDQLRANKKYISRKLSGAFDHVFGWERYDRWANWLDETFTYIDNNLWTAMDDGDGDGVVANSFYDTYKTWSPLGDGAGAQSVPATGMRSGMRGARRPRASAVGPSEAEDQSAGVVVRGMTKFYRSAVDSFSHMGAQLRLSVSHFNLAWKYYRFRQELVEKFRMAVQAVDEEQRRIREERLRNNPLEAESGDIRQSVLVDDFDLEVLADRIKQVSETFVEIYDNMSALDDAITSEAASVTAAAQPPAEGEPSHVAVFGRGFIQPGDAEKYMTRAFFDKHRFAWFGNGQKRSDAHADEVDEEVVSPRGYLNELRDLLGRLQKSERGRKLVSSFENLARMFARGQVMQLHNQLHYNAAAPEKFQEWLRLLTQKGGLEQLAELFDSWSEFLGDEATQLWSHLRHQLENGELSDLSDAIVTQFDGSMEGYVSAALGRGIAYLKEEAIGNDIRRSDNIVKWFQLTNAVLDGLIDLLNEQEVPDEGQGAHNGGPTTLKGRLQGFFNDNYRLVIGYAKLLDPNGGEISKFVRLLIDAFAKVVDKELAAEEQAQGEGDGSSQEVEVQHELILDQGPEGYQMTLLDFLEYLEAQIEHSHRVTLLLAGAPIDVSNGSLVDKPLLYRYKAEDVSDTQAPPAPQRFPVAAAEREELSRRVELLKERKRAHERACKDASAFRRGQAELDHELAMGYGFFFFDTLRQTLRSQLADTLVRSSRTWPEADPANWHRTARLALIEDWHRTDSGVHAHEDRLPTPRWLQQQNYGAHGRATAGTPSSEEYRLAETARILNPLSGTQEQLRRQGHNYARWTGFAGALERYKKEFMQAQKDKFTEHYKFQEEHRSLNREQSRYNSMLDPEKLSDAVKKLLPFRFRDCGAAVDGRLGDYSRDDDTTGMYPQRSPAVSRAVRAQDSYLNGASGNKRPTPNCLLYRNGGKTADKIVAYEQLGSLSEVSSLSVEEVEMSQDDHGPSPHSFYHSPWKALIEHVTEQMTDQQQGTGGAVVDENGESNQQENPSGSASAATEGESSDAAVAVSPQAAPRTVEERMQEIIRQQRERNARALARVRGEAVQSTSPPEGETVASASASDAAPSDNSASPDDANTTGEHEIVRAARKLALAANSAVSRPALLVWQYNPDLSGMSLQNVPVLGTIEGFHNKHAPALYFLKKKIFSMVSEQRARVYGEAYRYSNEAIEAYSFNLMQCYAEDGIPISMNSNGEYLPDSLRRYIMRTFGGEPEVEDAVDGISLNIPVVSSLANLGAEQLVTNFNDGVRRYEASVADLQRDAERQRQAAQAPQQQGEAEAVGEDDGASAEQSQAAVVAEGEEQQQLEGEERAPTGSHTPIVWNEEGTSYDVLPTVELDSSAAAASASSTTDSLQKAQPVAQVQQSSAADAAVAPVAGEANGEDSDIQTAEQCVICQKDLCPQGRDTMMYLPCGHMSQCEECAVRAMDASYNSGYVRSYRCTNCRADVTHLVRVGPARGLVAAAAGASGSAEAEGQAQGAESSASSDADVGNDVAKDEVVSGTQGDDSEQLELPAPVTVTTGTWPTLRPTGFAQREPRTANINGLEGDTPRAVASATLSLNTRAFTTGLTSADRRLNPDASRQARGMPVAVRLSAADIVRAVWPEEITDTDSTTPTRAPAGVEVEAIEGEAGEVEDVDAHAADVAPVENDEEEAAGEAAVRRIFESAGDGDSPEDERSDTFESAGESPDEMHGGSGSDGEADAVDLTDGTQPQVVVERAPDGIDLETGEDAMDEEEHGIDIEPDAYSAHFAQLREQQALRRTTTTPTGQLGVVGGLRIRLTGVVRRNAILSQAPHEATSIHATAATQPEMMYFNEWFSRQNPHRLRLTHRGGAPIDVERHAEAGLGADPATSSSTQTGVESASAAPVPEPVEDNSADRHSAAVNAETESERSAPPESNSNAGGRQVSAFTPLQSQSFVRSVLGHFDLSARPSVTASAGLALDSTQATDEAVRDGGRQAHRQSQSGSMFSWLRSGWIWKPIEDAASTRNPSATRAQATASGGSATPGAGPTVGDALSEVD